MAEEKFSTFLGLYPPRPGNVIEQIMGASRTPTPTPEQQAAIDRSAAVQSGIPADKWDGMTPEQQAAVMRAQATLSTSDMMRSVVSGAVASSRDLIRLAEIPSELVKSGLRGLGVTDPNLVGPSPSESFFPNVPDPSDALGAGVHGALVGMTFAVGGIRAGLMKTERAATAFGRVLQDYAQRGVERFWRVMGAEAAAGAGALTAQFYATELYPDDHTAQMLAALAGGISVGGLTSLLPRIGSAAASVATSTPVLGTVASSIRSIREYVSVGGALRRARDRLLRAEPDLRQALADAEVANVLSGVLTEIQSSGSQGLLSLERAVMESSAPLARERATQLFAVNDAIQESLVAVGGGGRATAADAREYLVMLVQDRLAIAAQRADAAFQSLGPGATAEDLNRLARVQIERALSDVRRQEDELFSMVPNEVSVQTDNVVNKYQIIVGSLSQAQRNDMPQVARELLDPRNATDVVESGVAMAPRRDLATGLPASHEAAPTGTFLGESTTVLELRGLQSNLREEARISRAAGQMNKARIADLLADTITEDLATLSSINPEAQQAIETAVAFSRDAAQMFRRGPVANLLGYSRTGGAAVDHGLTLESTLGRSGPEAAIETDALRNAIRFAERLPNAESSALGLDGYMQDFLRSKFVRETVRDGRVAPEVAERFIERNRDVLARFPELRREFNDAATTASEYNLAERMATDPRVSVAAILLRANPTTEMTQLFNQANPGEKTASLLRLIADGPGTAEMKDMAVAGLQNAFIERLMTSAGATARNFPEEMNFLAGRKLSDMLNDPRMVQIAEQLFTREQRDQLVTIQNTVLRLNRALNAGLPAEGILGDKPSMLLSVLAKSAGAVFGRSLDTGTIQVPAFFSRFFQRLVDAGVHDPASRLLTDAVRDPELFRDIMAAGSAGADTQATQAAFLSMRAWVGVVLADYGQIEPVVAPPGESSTSPVGGLPRTM